MTEMEISQVLHLIEEWVEQLSEERLNEQCRQSGANFFSYMTACGVNAGYLAKMITEATGYNPRQLWTVRDAELLRDAIFRYEGSVEAAKRGDEPRKAAKHFWGKSNGS